MRLSTYLIKPGLVLLSTLISAGLFIAVYEIYSHIQYDRWKASFDNSGWFGKMTILSPNPVLMWEYRPYGRKDMISTNRYGFRDLDFESRDRPANVFRVAFVGDSVTLGMGVSFGDTFVRHFEAEANKITFVDKASHLVPGFRVQALNFSVDGYNAVQIHEMVRTKVLAFSPHKVVYVMHLNDFDFKWSSGSKILYFRKPWSFGLLKAQQLYQIWEGDDYHRYHFRKNNDAVFQRLTAMRDFLSKAEVRFQLILVPVFTHEFTEYPVRDLHRKIAQFAQENDILFFDLLDAFSISGKSLSHVAADVWHPNATGHRFIGKQILPPILLN